MLKINRLYKYNNTPFDFYRFGKGEKCSETLMDQECFWLLGIKAIGKNRMNFIILDKSGITCLKNVFKEDLKYFEEVK